MTALLYSFVMTLLVFCTVTMLTSSLNKSYSLIYLGRHYCVIPLLRKCWPQCTWVLEHDNIESANGEKLSLQKDLAQHVLGLKKASKI